MWYTVIEMIREVRDMAIGTDLTEGKVAKQLVRYAAPLVITSLLQSVYSITDMLVAGQCIGKSGLSAINNASLVMNLVTQIAIGLTVGGNVLIGQLFGGNDEEGRKHASGTLFSLCLVIGAAGAVILGLLARPFMAMLKAPALGEAAVYLQICAIGLFPIFGYNALSAIFRAMGDSRRPLMVICCSTAINVALDILFVAVFRWGVAGAALATLAAQFAAFFISLGFGVRNKEALGLYGKCLRIDGEKCGKIFKLGVPIALQWAIASVSWLVVLFLINQYDVDPSAGNGISAKIKDFCQLFISAMTSGAATMIAQNLGAGLYDRAHEVMRTCMKITLGIAVALIVVVQLLAPALVSIFTPEAGVQYWAALNLRIEIFAQIFYAMFLTYNTLATGCGDTVFVMWNSFVNCILVRLILAVILDHFFGVVGVYAACAIAPASSVPIGWWYCRSGKWKKNAVKKGS